MVTGDKWLRLQLSLLLLRCLPVVKTVWQTFLRLPRQWVYLPNMKSFMFPILWSLIEIISQSNNKPCCEGGCNICKSHFCLLFSDIFAACSFLILAHIAQDLKPLIASRSHNALIVEYFHHIKVLCSLVFLHHVTDQLFFHYVNRKLRDNKLVELEPGAFHEQTNLTKL